VSLNPDDRSCSLSKNIMSVAPDSIDVSDAWSSLTLGDSEHQSCDCTAMDPTTGVIDGSDHTPASLLNLPREIRDMIHKLVAIASETSRPPMLALSINPYHGHLYAADERWKVQPGELLPRFDRSYNNLLLVNHQIHAEIAMVVQSYLPFSMCIGTLAAE